MSRLTELITGPPVHERRLEIKTFPANDGQVLVEGWLRDERLVDGFHWNGGARPAGTVHWMCVRLLVGNWPLKILDAEAEMPGVPHEMCPTTLDSVQKIVGLPIVSGYSEEVRRRLGGVAGCTHLTHLIVVMGPAALHGLWTQASTQKTPPPRSWEEMPGRPYLVNSCKLWAEDGPLLRLAKEFFDKKD
ncbi:MAG: DUF2889 domain-containing protein [Pseudomonadota bacterium]